MVFLVLPLTGSLLSASIFLQKYYEKGFTQVITTIINIFAQAMLTHNYNM